MNAAELGENLRMAIQQCTRALQSTSPSGLVTRANQSIAFVPTPSWLAETWRELLDVTGLEHRPQLVTVYSAGGSVGLFFPRVFHRNLVALGLLDLEALILKARGAGLIYAVPEWQKPDVDGPFYSDHDLRRALARAILAHELGHAILRARGQAQGGVAEERDADCVAGQLEELLGVEWEVGQLVFKLIGCRERVCSHPAPRTRVAAYDEGRLLDIDAREKREARERWHSAFGHFAWG